MDQILLYTNHIPRTTLIHNSFIENYMPEANGDYVKVYLYLAKCIQYQESGLSISSLADRMDNTEKDVIRALQYWEKRNLLQLDRDPNTHMITGIHMLPEQPAAHSHNQTAMANNHPDSTKSKTTVQHEKPVTNQASPADSTGTAQPDFHGNSVGNHTSFANSNGAAQSGFHGNPADNHTSFADSNGAAQSNFHGNSADTIAVSNYHAAPMQGNSSENVVAAHSETAATSYISTPMSGTPSAQTTAHTESKVVSIAGNSREISVSSALLQELASNEEFIWTCHVIESYLDRPMKPNETRLVSYLYGTLHFSKDLLLYLYEYCISLGKTNNNYIQAVALSWDEQGVTTPEEAEKASTAYNSAYNAVSKSLALGRSLATVEKKCVDRWQQAWHMDLSVILEACNRTILKVHKADFKYVEGILDRWQKNGVHTLQDVEKADLEYAQNKESNPKKEKNPPQGKSRNQFQNFQQRNTSSQEVDDLERRLLMR